MLISANVEHLSELNMQKNEKKNEKSIEVLHRHSCPVQMNLNNFCCFIKLENMKLSNTLMTFPPASAVLLLATLITTVPSSSLTELPAWM